MLFKAWVLLLLFFSNDKPELIYFTTWFQKNRAVARDFKSSNRNATGVWKCDEYRNYWVLINTSWICLEFASDFLDIELLDIDLPDADYDLLDTDIYSGKYFVGLQDVFKMCLDFFLKTNFLYILHY